MQPIQVRGFWDAEAAVWVAASANVPGLVTGAPGLDSLKAKLDVLIPELLAANGLLLGAEPSDPVELRAEFQEQITPVGA